MLRTTLAAACAAAILSAAPAEARDCKGTFVRRSCEASGGPSCPQPMQPGASQEFMGWDVTEGQKVYVVYRLGGWPAKDIKLEPGCRLPKYM